MVVGGVYWAGKETVDFGDFDLLKRGSLFDCFGGFENAGRCRSFLVVIGTVWRVERGRKSACGFERRKRKEGEFTEEVKKGCFFLPWSRTWRLRVIEDGLVRK